MKRILSVFLAVILAFSALSLCAFAQDAVNYVITNPYADVDWEQWSAYKTQLHCHTTASDGFQTIEEAVRDYYAPVSYTHLTLPTKA